MLSRFGKAGLALGLMLLAAAAPGTRKPKLAPEAYMPALPPAVIDDSLAIGGKDIEARKVRTRMTVAVNVNGTGPYRFVVDSGADTSVVGERIARNLALPPGKPVLLNNMTDSRRVDRVLVDSLQLGDATIENLQLPALLERDLGGEGMIGIDALVQQRLMMDFETRTIKVEDAAKPMSRQGMDGDIIVVARLRRGQLILTQVKANGRPIEAVVDTGSEITIGNLALRDQLIRRIPDKFKTIGVTGVTGVKMDLQLANISELRVGKIILRNIPIAFADVPPFHVFGMVEKPSLLLGTDILEAFRRVSLDFRARKVRFQLKQCGSTGIMLKTGYSSSLARLSSEKGSEVCKR
jgi:predicted aspartyl protease